ncbi:MAG TPA: acetate kinase [Deinococcales bacterium]|nr:acetate kinase [Deinococcales bacterium]
MRDVEILVVNCGSSSLKYAVFETDSRAVLARGLLERVGSPDATIRRGGATSPIAAPDHAAGFAEVARLEDFSRVAAVGHRVVHGGETFTAPTLVTEEVMAKLVEMSPLAPLHNPANIVGIQAASAALPGKPQVAVFDTGFHATLPPRAFLYALPRDLYEERRVRRYGFHGTSHQYVAEEAARLLGRPLEGLKVVTLHLGNGASACAVDGGRSVDTTMGFTPLEGLVMGTRSGDVDPGLVLELARERGVEATLELLNRKSGMLGLCGASDLRDVWAAAEAGDEWSRRALEVFAYRARKTVGAYAAAMGGLDAVVFTAGVGENDAGMRALILEGLGFLGLDFDAEANAARGPVITRAGSRVTAMVVATDEEWAIASAARGLLA